jgi:uncharacterized membrane protein
MESFLILALILLLGWLVAHTLSCGSDLREIQKKVLPLALAIPRLEKQIKELKDEILALQKKPESKPITATPVLAQPPHPPGTKAQLPAVTERTAAAVDVTRPIPVEPLDIKKEKTDLPPGATPAQVPQPIVAPVAPPAAIPSPVVPQAKAAEPVHPSPPPPPRPPGPEKQKFDWESIIGVKFFSWVAGIAMVVAAIFFLSYSIDKGWLQPPVQMTIGIIVGLGLLILCELKAAHKYRITANAMDASAVAILFATFFAAHALWQLIGAGVSFLFLVLVAVVAVLLSIRRDSLFIALLGLVGGFATPALLSTGENRPIGLFSYLLLLNAGLAWVAVKKKWPLLTVLTLVLTTLYQWGWVMKFLSESQLPLAGGIFLVFPILTFVTMILARQGGKKEDRDSVYEKSMELSSLMPVLFAGYMASVSGYGSHYVILFGFLFLLAAGLFAIALARGREILHLAGAISTLVVFAIWLTNSYDSGAWPAILAFLVLFVLFYLAAPLIACRFHRKFTGLGSRAVFAAPLLLPAFAVLIAIEPLCAAPGLIFTVLFLLMAAASAFAVFAEQGAIYYLAAFFALVAEAMWSAKFLTAERLIPGLAIYGIFGLFYIGTPMAARRWRKTLRPEAGGAVLVLASLALLFFLAHHGGVALWGLALLLLILNLGLLLGGSAAKFPKLSIAGIVLSWVVLGYFWSHAALAEILIPALAVVAGFAIMAIAGTIWLQKQSGGADSALIGNGIFLGLVGHLFLFVVAGQRALAVPPYPLLAVLLVLDLAVGMAALYTRRHELLIAAMGASALILIIWVNVAVEAPYPSIAILSAAALALFSFIWIYLAKRIGMRTERYADTAAMTVFLAQLVTIFAAQQPGAPGAAFLVCAHLLFLGALCGLAWFRSQHFLVILAVMPTGAAVGLWMALNAGPEFWQSQLLFAGLIYLVFLAYPMLLGRRAGSYLEPYLAAVLASVPFFFQAKYTIEAVGYGNIIGILPVTQAVLMAVLLLNLLRIDPPGARVLGRLALVAGTALAFVTAAIPLQLEKQWITIAWALEGAALAWLFRRIPHRGLLYTSTGLLAAVFVRLGWNITLVSHDPRSALAIWNWYLYTYLITAAAMILAGWLLSKTEDTVFEGGPRASKLFPAGGAILLFLLLNIEIADYYSAGDRITFNFTAALAQDLTYTLGWALFAVALLAVGIAIASRAARISSLGLLVITILKCFLHDLARLGGLYRVVSFVGLAICLSLVALALQKFVLASGKEAK